jgi:uncharacterized membrane protein
MDNRVPFRTGPGGFEQMTRIHNGAGGFHWAIFALLLLLVLLVFAQLMLTMWRPRFAGPRRWGGGHRPGGAPWGGVDPGAIARMRYARGEISRDEYVQLAQDLGGEPSPEAPAPPPA